MGTEALVSRVYEELSNAPDMRRATFFVDSGFTVKLSRQRKPNRRDRSETLVLTVGRPNYAERQTIRKSVGKFPFVALTPWPKKRAPKEKR